MSDQTPGDRIIAAASQHFHSLGPRSIDVPEWGCTIWFKPITVVEHQAILREAALNGGRDQGYVKAIIDKAMDENGAKLFTLEHRMPLLHGAYAGVVERVGEEILSTRHEPLPPPKKGESRQEQLEGNLEADSPRMVVMYVASRLKKFPHEVAAMPVADLEDLLAFWRLQAKRKQEG